MKYLIHFLASIALCVNFLSYEAQDAEKESAMQNQINAPCVKMDTAWGSTRDGLRLGIYSDCDKNDRQFTILTVVLKNESSETRKISQLDNVTVVWHVFGVTIAVKLARLPKKIMIKPGESIEYSLRENLKAAKERAESSKGAGDVKDGGSIWAEYEGLTTGKLHIAVK
jgi:hypothetical protein